MTKQKASLQIILHHCVVEGSQMAPLKHERQATSNIGGLCILPDSSTEVFGFFFAPTPR